MLLLVRSSLLAIFFVVPVLGSLYEYEDGTSPFGWLHAIMLGMGVSVAVAASILTVCGLRSCTNGPRRGTGRYRMTWSTGVVLELSASLDCGSTVVV